MTSFLRLRQPAALAALGAAAPLLVLLTAPAASASPVGKTCADSSSTVPVAMGLSGLQHRYVAGSHHWSGFRLRVRNRTAQHCPLTTVLAYAARTGTLRSSSVQLEWRSHGRWVRVPTAVRQGVLLALAGPGGGLDLKGHAKTQLPLRMRFPTNAPKGEWVTLSVGFTPTSTGTGGRLAWPVGVSDPHVLRVVRAPHARDTARHPQLAATGTNPAVTLAAGIGGAAAVTTGATLLILTRRAPSGARGPARATHH